MPTIDGYQAYVGQTGCESSPKPGVVYFRDHLNFWFGQRTSSIPRACNDGGQSEHKEGRALDYTMNVFDPAQAAKANEILNYLLQADQYGNQHARARRFGIMYIIWNRQWFRLYRPQDGWQPYTGPNPHTDHIHFSFGWPGANKQTSWWTTTQRTRSGSCGGKTNTIEFWHFASGYGPLTQLKKITDRYYNVTYSTQTAIRNSRWDLEQGATWYGDATQPLSLLSSSVPKARVSIPTGVCRIAMN
jgi:hypothetical protein